MNPSSLWAVGVLLRKYEMLEGYRFRHVRTEPAIRHDPDVVLTWKRLKDWNREDERLSLAWLERLKRTNEKLTRLMTLPTKADHISRLDLSFSLRSSFNRLDFQH